ncbi:MAG: hypothetical protein U0872_09485 [Planctomycetaceae bacterium]
MATDSASRRSLFAVWRWPWWVQFAAIATNPLAYLLSWPVCFYCIMADKLGPEPMPRWAFQLVWTFYEPAMWCGDKIPFLMEVWGLELSLLQTLFGELTIGGAAHSRIVPALFVTAGITASQFAASSPDPPC